MNKKIVFLSGTRADFGKMKSLMLLAQNEKGIHVDVFVTGMHLQKSYGYTLNEIKSSNIKNIYKFNNSNAQNAMDITLSKTIEGFSRYLKNNKPDMIIVHGDRVEALAGAICGAINNILVAHIEGGEVSGTIDDSIRHAVSKFSHIHLVTDSKSKKRLVQLGEKKSNIFILGSPDLDLMTPKNLPNLDEALRHYDIKFKEYAIVLYHPVTSEISKLNSNSIALKSSLVKSKGNYIVIYPNNDHGSDLIIKNYVSLKSSDNFAIFPSIRFEYFLTILKHSQFIIGNSSCGLREAPHFNVPTINIGTRQNNRRSLDSIKNCGYSSSEILKTINKIQRIKQIDKINSNRSKHTNSAKKFIKILNNKNIWQVSSQKIFNDIKF
ncbi:UDP-N-acetylglucosamine 2-epimerase [Gammaproteobacteria bacterium]|nr:UDP-N-acetylglucosamine 2-epimerase [Gammaproteobacteria bacterium]